MSCHISWLTAFRFAGWLKMIQPIGPSFSSSSGAVAVMGASSWREASHTLTWQEVAGRIGRNQMGFAQIGRTPGGAMAFDYKQYFGDILVAQNLVTKPEESNWLLDVPPSVSENLDLVICLG